ncbi:sugar ABC transporter substrate-binding protein [Cohnella lubricantis]|uniref:Sugar ABC transporter substrate-binding protein n=1 Tax=Cohnella lubricantis TaxID=2163172 RepID=A0A841TEK7_9BACL|nr:sugar ABC transporter substrate-binding protein [Cohnella lubricantis]MBB6678419.1 sugar ABC transporter substrate-binding protein [Cohnella lubricantis]MBP2116799.1 multiple sugar transport system substrate-binding protein [Cohnella lubricantis]
MQAQTKKSLAVLVTAPMILSLALTACGGGSNNGSNAGPSQSAASSPSGSASASAPANAPSGEPVTIEVWANKFEDTTSEWFKKWTDEFNKSQSNVKVNLTIVPGDAWAQKMKAAQAAGKAPDVWTISYNGVANSAKLGEIQALNDLMDQTVFDDLYDNMKDFVAVGDKYYAYPWLVEPSTVLYYRKDMFQEAGLDPEKPPATWDELLADAEALTKKGVFGFSTAQTAAEIGWSSWGLQYNAAGHLPITDDWSKADLADEGFKKLVSFYQQAYQSGSMPKQALAGYTDAKPFGEGKIAMMANGSWAIGQIRNDYKDIVDKVGVAPMPTIDGNPNNTTATLGGWSLAVDGKSKHPKEAASYIQYLLAGDPNVVLDYFRGAQFSKFTPRKSVDEAMASDPEASKDAVRAMIAEKIVPYSKPEPIYPWDISLAFATAIESAMKGTDVDKALDKAEKDINDFITKNKTAGTNPKMQ